MSSPDMNTAALKKTNGLKVKIRTKKKESKVKRKLTTGLPPPSVSVSVRRFDTAAEHDNEKHKRSATTVQQQDDFPVNDGHMDEIPCDTLLAIQSLEQSRQCFYIPLKKTSGGPAMIPAVLESQLYTRLDGLDGQDSVATQELQQLLRDFKIVRLQSQQHQDDDTTALVETRHYVRAVWDAHRNHLKEADDDTFQQDVVSWFVSNLQHLAARRTIRKDDLQQVWNQSNLSSSLSSAASKPLSKAIDLLVQMQLLMPRASSSSVMTTSTFILWLPNWGLVLSSLAKARRSLELKIKRSMYKELSVQTIEQSHQSQSSGFSGRFVLESLVAQGRLEIIKRPAGEFVKLSTT